MPKQVNIFQSIILVHITDVFRLKKFLRGQESETHTLSSMAKCHKLNPYQNKFWWCLFFKHLFFKSSKSSYLLSYGKRLNIYMEVAEAMRYCLVIFWTNNIDLETCWKSKTIFNIIRPCFNIGLVCDTLQEKLALKKINLWKEISTQNLISAFPSGRRSRRRLQDCPVESNVGVSRPDRAVRVFWRPLFLFFRNEQKAKWFQIDERTHYDIQTERKKEKREKKNN